MKILSLVKARSSAEQITFQTEPALSVEMSSALSRLKNKHEVLQQFEIDADEGLLVVRTGAGNNPIAFPRGFKTALSQALKEAEQHVDEVRRKKKEQEEQAQQELEQAIQAAAKAFSVPVIQELVDPSRKLGNDFE